MTNNALTSDLRITNLGKLKHPICQQELTDDKPAPVQDMWSRIEYLKTKMRNHQLSHRGDKEKSFGDWACCRLISSYKLSYS